MSTLGGSVLCLFGEGERDPSFSAPGEHYNQTTCTECVQFHWTQGGFHINKNLTAAVMGSELVEESRGQE